MVRVNCTGNLKNIEIERVLGKVMGSHQKPTLVFVAGIHGNETAGVYALHNVMKTINSNSISIKGNIVALSGNMNALNQGIRYDDVDLNRVWTHEKIEDILSRNGSFKSEEKEQKEIFNKLKEILKEDSGPFYFIDLHTTSAHTIPFVTISDCVNNRKFSSKFPIPTILGIEEYLDGPLLSYINEFGHVALGFEAGQHDAIASIYNSEAFIWMALVNAGCIDKEEVVKYDKSFKLLSSFQRFSYEFYEIDFRYHLHKDDQFAMQGNFVNFEKIKKNQLLAKNNDELLYAPFSGYIFMPLYQSQGEDGYFIVTKISNLWLFLSKILRRIHFHHILRLLPGVRQSKKDKHTLIVNKISAKYLATEIFHLFGYRKKVLKKDKWLFIKRDRKVTAFY